MATRYKSVDDYIAAQPESVRAALADVRSAIRRAVPKAEESISYNMAAYKLNGKPVLYFAAWKKHYSLYPAGTQLLAAFADELAVYEVDKSTIRFPFDRPVPRKLIGQVARFRVNNNC